MPSWGTNAMACFSNGAASRRAAGQLPIYQFLLTWQTANSADALCAPSVECIRDVRGLVMARSRGGVGGNLSSGRWLLRWSLVLQVSATFAYALNDAITGRAVPDGRLEVTVAPGIANLPCMLS